jgi:hypothetical protein
MTDEVVDVSSDPAALVQHRLRGQFAKPTCCVVDNAPEAAPTRSPSTPPRMIVVTA